MRRENTLDVNVHQRAIRAAERTSPNNGLQDTLELVPTEPRWWNRILPSPEVLNVNGRQVNGFVVQPWAAGVLLAALIGGGGYFYRTVSSEQQSQRDMLIEMKTELRVSKEHELEYRQEFKDKQELQQVYINDLTKQLVRVQSVLTPAQAKAVQLKKLQEN